MKFSDYRKLTVRTMSDTGSKITDSVHMTLGLNSEVMGELPDAIANEDLVNFKEEMGDTFWYLANYCNIWELEPTDLLLEHQTPDKFDVLKIDKTAGQQYMIIFGIGQNIALLQDLDKKHLAYGKHGDDEMRLKLVNDIYSVIEHFCFVLGIDTDKVRENNIEKLTARYPDLVFDREKAINRDLSAERTILEQ
jgi:hypothetical protein